MGQNVEDKTAVAISFHCAIQETNNLERLIIEVRFD